MPTHQTDRHAPSRSTADCGLRTRTLGNLLPAALTLVLLSAAPARAQTTRTVRELMAAGDTAWTARQQGAARAAYAEVVRRDSSYSRAFYRLATLLAWKNSLDEALALYRLYTRLEPRDANGPLAVARTLAWASRYGEAIATYDSLLARDRGLQPAALGRAHPRRTRRAAPRARSPAGARGGARAAALGGGNAVAVGRAVDRHDGRHGSQSQHGLLTQYGCPNAGRRPRDGRREPSHGAAGGTAWNRNDGTHRSAMVARLGAGNDSRLA